ncbi:MAG: hypothetical protein ACE5H5_06765, partial [Nitrospinota bacterium]
TEVKCAFKCVFIERLSQFDVVLAITKLVSSQYLGGKGHVGIASLRRLSRPSGRIETKDASGSTDNPFEKITKL